MPMWNEPNFEYVEQRFTRRLLVLCIAAAAIGPKAGVDKQLEASSGMHPDVSHTLPPTGASSAQVLETMTDGCSASECGSHELYWSDRPPPDISL